MNWKIRKPIWGSLEEPKFDSRFFDLGLGFHNGQPIIVSGAHESDTNDVEATLVKLLRDYREQ